MTSPGSPDNDEPTCLRDEAAEAPVRSSQMLYRGPIFSVRRDEVDFGGDVLERDICENFGAVAVVAVDDQRRVLLINQYRHAVRQRLWELPAGLADVSGEALVDAARRELREETDHDAADWELLLQQWSSPGFSTERISIYLARSVSLVTTQDRHVRTEEESEISMSWVPLDDVVDAILTGRVHNAILIAGVLAAQHRIPAESQTSNLGLKT